MAAVVAIITTITSINMVQANTVPATVAILDTSLNSNLSVFKDRIVHEVCILEWNSCKNGSNFMEGPGAAGMPSESQYVNGFDHGTKMTHASILSNPNIKIVFIRIVGATASGVRQVTNEQTFVNALKWVSDNKNKFNIQAVALSQGHYNLGSGQNYCPNTPNTANILQSLSDSNVPVFIAAGNNRDLKRITWPACIKTAISISAATTTNGPTIYTNYDVNATDIFALGRLRVTNPYGILSNEEGTSVSAQVAAATYMYLRLKYPTYSSKQLVDLLISTGNPLISKTLTGKVVNGSIVNG